MARIFAKALNCKNGPTVKPCGQCQACVEIEGARSLDVLEIDGASNRGIDEIRTLRENVKFSPALGKFKIYIIDEVHQITPDGFNALLKTLEEPPAHVKFIFATTASHKVPATILSRCQRFDFRRIPTHLIADTLKEICKLEKIKIDEEALYLIAKAADGSLRDGQSILDQIAASGKDKIAKEDVVRSLGALEEERLLDLTESLANQDAGAAVLFLNEVINEGKDPSLFMEKFLEHTRNLLFVSVSEKLTELVDATDTYKKSLLKQKGKFSKDDLFYFFSVISHTLQTLRRFESKRIPIEIALIKLAQRVPMTDLAKVLQSLESAEKKTPENRPPAKVKVTDEEDAVSSEIEELPSGELPISGVFQEKILSSLDAVWELLIKGLKNEKMSAATYLEEGEPAGLHQGVAKVLFPERLRFHRESLETDDNRKLIERHLSTLLDQAVRVEFQSVKETAEKPETDAKSTPAEAPAKISLESEGVVKSAMDIFGGRIVK